MTTETTRGGEPEFCAPEFSSLSEIKHALGALAVTPRETLKQRHAAELLAHVRHNWYRYTYHVCVCGHSEHAHGSYGCEGVTDENQFCECKELRR